MAYMGDPQADLKRLAGVLTGQTNDGPVTLTQQALGATWYGSPMGTYSSGWVTPDWQRQQQYLEQQRAAQEAFSAYHWQVEQQRQQQPKKEQVSMRGLFEVFVVNPEMGDVVAREVVVADSDKKAELKVMRALEVDPDDVDIIVRRIGDVRPKRKVSEVRIVKE